MTGRSGARKVRRSGWPASPHARSTRAAGQVIPVRRPAAAPLAIILSPCWGAPVARDRPAMSSCAGPVFHACRMGLRRAIEPGRFAARRRSATSPARWSGVAMPSAGGVMAATVCVDRSSRRTDLPTGRIDQAAPGEPEPFPSTYLPYGGRDPPQPAPQGPSCSRLRPSLPAPALVRRFPSGLSALGAPASLASPWPGFSRSGRSRRRTWEASHDQHRSPRRQPRR